MEQKQPSESDLQCGTLRRSTRCNLGVPPRRLAETYSPELRLNVPYKSTCASTMKQQCNRVLAEKSASVVDHLRTSECIEIADEDVRKTKSELISVDSNVKRATRVSSTKSKISSKSKRSEISHLNLELMVLKQKQKLDEEEAEEKLKAIEVKRANLMHEMQIQKKLLENAQDRSDSESSKSFHSDNSYSNTKVINKWIEDSEKYIRLEPEYPSRCIHENIKDDAATNLCSFASVACDDSSHSLEFGGKDKAIIDLATKCIDSSIQTNKLLSRQKLKDLTHFNGDLTEWPIFISEFNRTTQMHGLTDDENLIRLDRSLRGKARDTVRALLISPSNVSKIIKMLEMNFGRSEWIILSLIEKVKKLPCIREDKVESYITFSNAINNMVITMKNVNSHLYLYNPELLSILMEKLTSIQRYSWGKQKQQLEAHGEHVSLEQFSEWFEDETNMMTGISNPFQRSNSRNFQNKEKVMVSKDKSPHGNSTGCVFCQNSNHVIQECGEFSEKTIKDRREVAANLKLCFLCLKKGHTVNKCFLKNRCGENDCRGRHHKLLHIQRDTSLQEEKKEFCANLISSVENSVLLRIAPVTIRGPAGEMETFAMFDEGSTCTMIDEAFAKKLELSGPKVPLCYQWTNGITHYEDDSELVSFNISSSRSSVFYKIHQVRTVGNLNLPCQKLNVDELCKKYPHLDRDILESVESAVPLILIGQDNAGLIIPRQIIQPKLNQPIMSSSRLGWTINGPINNADKDDSIHISLCCRQIGDEDLHQLVKDSFRLDSSGIVKVNDNVIKSAEDKKAVEIMENTLKRIENRFEVGILWKNENVTLPDSLPNAMKRLFCMERKMDKDERFADQYCAKIDEYVSKNYASKLAVPEAIESKKTWYLPHFAVWNVNKPGKLRFVFDAAAKSHGFSLNDFLLQGPDYVPSLLSVLWRFRQGKIAFNGDIKEMFHQVVIREQDRNAQRFLWRGKDRQREPDVYQMNVMIFGAVSSPSVAQFVKNKNAVEFEPEFPGITRSIHKQHYVDDYLDSCDTEEEAMKRIADVIYVHAQAGFEMVKWITNSTKVLLSIPENIRSESQNNVEIGSEGIERVLGLFWNPRTDDFKFTLSFKKIPLEISDGVKKPTKREVLRLVMSIFDPFGFLAPLVVRGRLIMQDIWKTSIDWDTKITDDIFLTWTKWLMDLKTLTPISIPRCYFSNVKYVHNVQLHMFCDASDKAYATVAFIRFQDDEHILTAFIASKYKVAPLKQQTIPKLELQGAVLACRVAKSISMELEYKIESIHYWTDSLVVLKQIRSQTRRFPMFVSCRIGEIQEETDISKWRWIPSDLNVADQATKETKNINFGADSLWLNGPDFLKLSEEFWPVESTPVEQVENVSVIAENPNKELVLPDISRFSRWRRLIRSTAWILYFKKICRVSKSNRPASPALDVELLEEASKLWVKKSQGDVFEEISLLQRGESLSRSSRLYKLSAYLDEEGIVRLKGRFPDSERLHLDYDIRFPIVLDPKHKYTVLLIDHYHEEAGHVGIETVINSLRNKFWILHMRAAVKRCFKSCLKCKIRTCKPTVPEMGLLPPSRLESHVFPFSYVGLDFFGPMTVSIGRRVEKRYGVLFTCLSVRAVHIELAASLDTSSTIMAIRRFICRRGQPKEIWTDNGTNFVGAERELRECINSLDHDKISNDLILNGCSWKFNCPGAPNMAGVWERMVKSIKTALKISMKNINPREEVLLTLLYEAEYMINSRPLTHISVDPGDLEAITPNHFLLLRPGGVPSYGVNSTCSKKQWRIAQSLADLYWRRWVQEYRPTLVRRQKWHDHTKPIQKGDVVIIVDEKAPRNEWLMGRIEETYPGNDGIIRVVKVKTNKGCYTRPVSKLCSLPTTNL